MAHDHLFHGSVGQAIAQAAYSLARRAASEVIGEGTFDVLADADPFGEANGAPRPRQEATVDANVREY